MIVLVVVASALVATAWVVVERRRPAPVRLGPEGVTSVHDVLVRRFIDRSQRFRRTGALVGIILMTAGAIAVSSLGDEGGALNLVQLASIGLAGSVAGSILAEAFRVQPPGPRIASLEVRDPDAYRDRTADRREVVVLALGAVGAGAALVLGHDVARALALAAAVVALALVRRWALRRIALRPRPAVPAEVAAADDEVRRLASSAGVSRPMVTLAALLVATQWALAGSPVEAGAAPAMADVLQLGSVVLFGVACWWWWANRSFGLAPAQLDRVGGSRSHLAYWALGTFVALAAMVVVIVLARSGS